MIRPEKDLKKAQFFSLMRRADAMNHFGEVAMVAGSGVSASGRRVGFTALIAVGLITVGSIAAVPAGAQTSQQISGCSGGKDGPEQKIAACTAVIQSGRYSGKSLALVFNNRANGYLKKGDDDRAVADYDQALKLDPNYALAYNNRGNAYFRKKNYDRAIAD
jgi:tetratricopeptide (TPR) repeat protein